MDSGEFPVWNPKLTHYSAVPYIGLALKKYESGTWLIALKGSGNYFSPENTGMEGTIVLFTYVTGSHKHTHHKYVKWFIVRNTGRVRVLFKDLVGSKDVEAEVYNLEALEEPTSEEVGRINADLRNMGWKLSNYDPVNILYYYWIVRKIAGNAPPNPCGLEQVFIIRTDNGYRISRRPVDGAIIAYVRPEDLGVVGDEAP